jgi:hypothetical protein
LNDHALIAGFTSTRGGGLCPRPVSEAEVLKMVSGIKAKCYVERYEELGLDTLEKRRRIQDIVQSYRILCSTNDGYASG